MPSKTTKPAKRRTQVKDLPKEKKELSKQEQKKIKGGSSWWILEIGNKSKQ